MDKFTKTYLNIIRECNSNKLNKHLIKEDDDFDEDEDIEEQLEEAGFSTCCPDDDIMIKLLEYATENAITVYNTIINQDGYCERYDGKNDKQCISITEFADCLYCYFPSELITDSNFKENYIKFQTWFDEFGYDGWCGYGDRGGYLDDPYIIEKIHDIFDSVTDGTNERPLICNDVTDWDDDDEDEDNDNDEDEQ